jgi:hypothetical protein
MFHAVRFVPQAIQSHRFFMQTTATFRVATLEIFSGWRAIPAAGATAFPDGCAVRC